MEIIFFFILLTNIRAVQFVKQLTLCPTEPNTVILSKLSFYLGQPIKYLYKHLDQGKLRFYFVETCRNVDFVLHYIHVYFEEFIGISLNLIYLTHLEVHVPTSCKSSELQGSFPTMMMNGSPVPTKLQIHL